MTERGLTFVRNFFRLVFSLDHWRELFCKADPVCFYRDEPFFSLTWSLRWKELRFAGVLTRTAWRGTDKNGAIDCEKLHFPPYLVVGFCMSATCSEEDL